MKLSRQIGQTSQILNLFVQDASVSTGAGLANIPATTVSYTWFHNTGQAAVSSGVAVSTASLGNYTSGAWTQISSSLALGWYQFGLPDGALAAGDAVGVHVYVSTGVFAMAPLPIEIELTRENNQQFYSSQAISSAAVVTLFVPKVNVSSWANSTVVATSSGVVDVNLVNIWNKSAVTSNSGILTVSTQSLAGIVVSTQTVDKTGYIVNVSAWANSTVVATSSGVVDVNLVNIWNKSAVTSNSGILTVSTQALDKTGYIVNVSAWANSTVVATSSGVVDVNLVNIWNKSAVTTNSGILQVSTQSLVGITVSTQSLVGITTAANLIQIYGSAAVTSGSGILNVSTQQLPAAGAGDITTIYGQPIVTSAAGIMDINVKNVGNTTAATAGAGKFLVSTQSLAGIVVSTQSLVGIVVSTQAIDKGGYGVTTNADKTAYSLTAAERAAIMDVINTTVVAESYRVVSTEATVTQLMYEVLGNLTSFANSGTTRAVGSMTSGIAIATYQYDSTTPSAITRIS